MVVRGFFEVHPHHDLQRVAELVTQWAQALRVLHRRHRVVDRAGPDHHRQAVVAPVQDLVQRSARVGHGFGGALIAGQQRQQLRRRCEGFDLADTQVIGHRRHNSVSVGGVASGSQARRQQKAASVRWRLFGNAAEVSFRVSAILPPPAALENRSTKKIKLAAGCVHACIDTTHICALLLFHRQRNRGRGWATVLCSCWQTRTEERNYRCSSDLGTGCRADAPLSSGDIAAANRLDANKQSSNDRTGRLGKSHSPPGASPLQTAARVSTRPPRPTECVAINAPPRHRHVRADRRVMRRQCSGGRTPRVGFADRGDCRCDCRFIAAATHT